MIRVTAYSLRGSPSLAPSPGKLSSRPNGRLLATPPRPSCGCTAFRVAGRGDALLVSFSRRPSPAWRAERADPAGLLAALRREREVEPVAVAGSSGRGDGGSA
jgi:hypothetical protein